MYIEPQAVICEPNTFGYKIDITCQDPTLVQFAAAKAVNIGQHQVEVPSS